MLLNAISSANRDNHPTLPSGETFCCHPMHVSNTGESSNRASAIYQQLKTEGWPNSRIASPGLPDRQSCA
jgi:hypothetical protein